MLRHGDVGEIAAHNGRPRRDMYADDSFLNPVQ